MTARSEPTTQRSASPEPGWYDDPAAAGWMRYWDGDQWTLHRQPMHNQPLGAGRHATDPMAAVPVQRRTITPATRAREYDRAEAAATGAGAASGTPHPHAHTNTPVVPGTDAGGAADGSSGGQASALPAVQPARPMTSAEALAAPPPAATAKPQRVPFRTRVNPALFSVGKGLIALSWVLAWLSGLSAISHLWGVQVHGAADAFLEGTSTQSRPYDVFSFITTLHLIPTAIAASVCWLVWQYHVAHCFPKPSLRATPQWQIASWCLPLFNIYAPLPHVANLNDNVGKPARPVLLGAWWTCWMLVHVLVCIALAVSPAVAEPADLVVRDVALAAACAFGAVGAGAAALIATRIQRSLRQFCR